MQQAHRDKSLHYAVGGVALSRHNSQQRDKRKKICREFYRILNNF
jgi:hypothetical protein